MSQIDEMKSTKSIRKILFLALGLTRVHGPQEPNPDPIIEPDGVRICRRNIIALAGLLVLAGFTGADPGDLSVFGVRPGEGTWGVIVIGTAAIAVQVYWYWQKYYHLKEDGKIDNRGENKVGQLAHIDEPTDRGIVQKRANLLSNRVAFSLSFVSLCFIIFWIGSAHANGAAT